MEPFTMIGSMAALALAVKVARARRKFLEAKAEVEAAETEQKAAEGASAPGAPAAVSGDLPVREAKAREAALGALEASYHSSANRNLSYEQNMRASLRAAYKVYKAQGGKLLYKETQATFYDAMNPKPPHLRAPRPGFEMVVWPTVEELMLEE